MDDHPVKKKKYLFKKKRNLEKIAAEQRRVASDIIARSALKEAHTLQWIKVAPNDNVVEQRDDK